MRQLLVVLALLVALPGLAAALHLAVLTVASLGYRARGPAGDVPPVRFLVIVPAHNEEKVIGAALDAIFAVIRDRDRVLVVADRCTDSTASIARRHGADVLERGGGDPPGRAAARQAALDHAESLDWDAVVMIDADSIVSPGFFDVCEDAMADGGSALQVRSESTPGRSLVEQASVAAFALQGVTIPRGRHVLGCSVRLRGTGMVLRREVLRGRRFHAPASEDLFLTLDLCLDGVRPRHVEAARLHSQMAGSWRSAAAQRTRYESGRMSASRVYLGQLLRRHDRASLEAAWFLASPPVATSMLLLAAGLALAIVGGNRVVIAVILAAMSAMVLVVIIGLIQARAGVRTWLALLAAPWYVLWKVPVQLRALVSTMRRQEYFEPTERH